MFDLHYRINRILVHHPSLRWINTLAKKLGIIRFLHVLDVKNDKNAAKEMEQFKAFYDQHQDEFQRLSEMLEDDMSRYTLEKVIEYRKTRDTRVLKDVFVEPQYFQKDIFGPVKDEVFVDGGAYVGDTVESFIKNFAGGGYKRIYSWEPDATNMATLKKVTSGLKDIVYVPCGMWKEKSELYFQADDTAGAKIVENDGQNIIKIDVDSIDNVCSGDKVTFIKMDIEGSEQAALQGAVQVIKRDKPRLAISIYHKYEDLYEIPFWVKQMVPEYKLYIRHHNNIEWDTVLYATL